MNVLDAVGLSLASDPHTVSRQRILRDALGPFVDELRLVDFGDLAAHVMGQQFANLDDIVQSSLEPFYLPGCVNFGWAAELALSWSEPPLLALEMEFCGQGIAAFFVLQIAANCHDILLRSIRFVSPSADPRNNTRALADALRATGRAGQASDKPTPAR